MRINHHVSEQLPAGDDVQATGAETAAALPPAAPAPLSLRAYAQHRGTSATSVLRAIRSGRLHASLVTVRLNGRVVQQIADAQLADQEWAAQTDLLRAPDRQIAAAPGQPADGLPLTSQAGAAAAPTPLTAVTIRQREASASEREYKARIAEIELQERQLELERKRGDVLSKARVVADLQAFLVLFRGKLLAIPSQLRTELPDLRAADLAIVDRLIRGALVDIAAEMSAGAVGGVHASAQAIEDAVTT